MRTRLRFAFTLAAWRWRWLVWFLSPAFRYGDPLLGTGEERAANRRILFDRYYAREPKRPQQPA